MTPNPDDLLKHLDFGAKFGEEKPAPAPVENAPPPSVLDSADQKFLADLVAQIHEGKSAVILVQIPNGFGTIVRYMLTNADKAQATIMIGRALEDFGRQMREK